jgi:hypothetical protein
MRFIDFIRDRARYYNCPVCGRSLRDCELRLLRQAQERYTVQVTCAACHVQFVVIMAVQGGGLEALTQDEVRPDEMELAEDADLLGDSARTSAERGHRRSRLRPREPEREPIQSDELLDVHLLLRAHQGSLTDLFKQPSGDRS